MGNIDWAAQPSWLIALAFFGTGVIVPIALAWIGKSRSKEDEAPAPSPIQVESPWMIIELNTISTSVQEIRREVAEVRRLVEHAISVIKNNNYRNK